jgi:Bacterial archaeo-eukaryotic release factor family 10
MCGAPMLTQQVLQELATAEPERLVISVYARTDPRDPANVSVTPAWLIELRNGLRTISARLENGDDRESRLAFRALRPRIEEELIELTPGERARSVAWVLDADRTFGRFSLQLPLRRDHAVADAKPFVSPLVDIADRGAPVGVVLVGSELIRILQIEQAEVAEPENSSFELSLGDWRPFGGSAGGSPQRGLQFTSHEERYEARVEAQRERLFETAATETARRVEALGWERIVLIAEGQVASRFRQALPASARERIVADADLNLVGDELSVIADTVEPLIEGAWQRRADALAGLASERAKSGGAATLGPQETLGALAEGRVDHLLIDLDCDFSSAAGMIPPSLGGSGDMLGERAVETAIATSARVTSMSADASAALRDADGMASLLRY